MRAARHDLERDAGQAAEVQEYDAIYKKEIEERIRGGEAAGMRPAAAVAGRNARRPAQTASDLKQLQFEDEYLHQQILWLDVELQMRPALSVGCFCFILVGCPVGIWFSRSDYSARSSSASCRSSSFTIR